MSGVCVDCGGPCTRCALRCWTCGVRARHQSLCRRHADTDEVAVLRLIGGSPVKSTRGERQQAVATLTGYKLSAREIAERLRVSERTVVRLRARAAA